MSNISICTVSIEPLEPYLDIMIKSATTRLINLKEIVITCVDSHDEFEVVSEQNGVTIRKFGYGILKKNIPLLNFFIGEKIMGMTDELKPTDIVDLTNMSAKKIVARFGHALGLHHCISCSSYEYIMFCDPDIIFLNNVDKIYLDLMHKHSLQYIGCAHESACKAAYKYFPYVANSLVRKEDLPDCSFLVGDLYFTGALNYTSNIGVNHKLQADGKWLISGFLPNHYKKFFKSEPTQKELEDTEFDTASNLYIWALENNWRWLSFLTPDCQYYKTSFYRSNCAVKNKSKVEKLIYHQFGRFRDFEEFQKAYKENEVES